MNSSNCRIIKKTFYVFTRKFYQTPVNRWQYHYAAGDNYERQVMTYIERKNMPQPLTKEFGLKYTTYDHPNHTCDFRYKFDASKLPKRSFVHELDTRFINKNDTWEMMHGNEWPDLQIDYQIEEPITSNHYIQNAGATRIIYFLIYFVVFTFVYAAYGYGLIDQLENKIPYRKRIQTPDKGFTFLRTDDFQSWDGITTNPQHDYVIYNKDGNMIPKRIFDFPMIDEKIFRI